MMKTKTNPAIIPLPARSRVIEFPQSTQSSESEQAIEDRLKNLGAFVADLSDSGYGLLLSEEIATRDIFDELRVKEAAMRWIVRVAKHSSGAVRERLWSDIEDAVAGLEKTADLLLHAEFGWLRAAPASQQSWRAGPERF